MSLQHLFAQLWSQYSTCNEQAGQIHALLEAQGERIVNDHIALRTFRHPKTGIAVLAKPFLDLGYAYVADYHFPDKKLYARHFAHPDPEQPLVFISELKLEECSPSLQKTIGALIDAIPEQALTKPDFLTSGIQWPMISHATYLELLAESEYAAWTATFGFRANHFTVLVNRLQNFDLLSLNAFIKSHGWPLNAAGGEVKGTPADFLEQSSTLAAKIEVAFADTRAVVPCCYYEFAQRHPMPNGKLFAGFVTTSADKIFESTNVSR